MLPEIQVVWQENRATQALLLELQKQTVCAVLMDRADTGKTFPEGEYAEPFTVHFDGDCWTFAAVYPDANGCRKEFTLPAEQLVIDRYWQS